MTAVFLFPLLWVIGLSLKTRLQVFANAAAVRLVADAGELCRRARPGRLPAGLRQQPGGVVRRGAAVALRRRAGGLCVRAVPVPRPVVPVLLAAGHAHAAADRGAGADVRAVQQARPDHDAASAWCSPTRTFSLPLVVWIMRGFFEDLPRELEESAWVDGASPLRRVPPRGAAADPARAWSRRASCACSWRGTTSCSPPC